MDPIPWNIQKTSLLDDYTINVENQKFSSFLLPYTEEKTSEIDKYLDFDFPNEEFLIERKLDVSQFYTSHPSRPTRSLEAKRDRLTGNVTGISEVYRPEMAQESHESLSLLRKPSDVKDFVRGSSQNVLFKPGGFEEKTKIKPKHELNGEQEIMLLERGDFCTVPPGFTHGVQNVKNTKFAPVVLNSNVENLYSNAIVKKEYKKKDILQLDQSFFDDADVLFHSQEKTPIAKVDYVEKSTRDDFLEELVQEITTDGAKQKEYAIMERMDVSSFSKLVPNMAIQYPFDLDVFQKEAIIHLERRENVFVAAHTSAGKTVVAEYAIALSKQHLSRTIYTSPIKSLSNQKYREFKKTFDDVGLLTGDVQINPTATCLIMTTEILRSMLYKGADLIRDVEWVIFDEVHYIQDAERGVVWEETIIMLPEHVGLVFLSATIPNTYEFADWIGRTKKKEVYVMSTLKRPVPLEFHLYFNNDIYKIVDNTSTFLNVGYRSCIQAVKEKSGKKSKNIEPFGEWINVIEVLKKKKLLPAIVFSFSRKKCEEVAFGLRKVDLTTPQEKHEIFSFYSASVARLSKPDRTLPQVVKMKDLLDRGIGLHHSGLLPIVKEVIEILFAKGLIKILLATETFAMGVNMPSRCVLFNGLRKHDGKNFRDLLSSEFIQMSGRAGRRGIDTVGVVMVLCWDEVPEEILLQKLILGKANRLESKFRLSYNMMLNLLRVEDFKIEDLMKRSFSEAKTQRFIPNSLDVYEKAKSKLQDIEELDCIYQEPLLIQDFYDNLIRVVRVYHEYNESLFNSKNGSSLLAVGRVMVVADANMKFHLGVFVKSEIKATKRILSFNVLKTKSIDYLPFPSFNALLLEPGLETIEVASVCVVTEQILKIDTNIEGNLVHVWENNEMSEVQPKDLKISSLDIIDGFKKKQSIIKDLRESKCYQCPKFPEHFKETEKREKIRNKIEKIRFAMSDENLELKPELEKRIQVLKHLQYIDQDNTVLLKGRCACEINSCEELILVEMVFENIFTTLAPEECVAVLSTLICQEKTDAELVIPETLRKPKEQILKITETLGEIQREYGLDTNAQEYSTLLKFDMMELALAWAQGASFQDVTKLTTILEGSIVRSITQIDQACKEVRNVARVIGDSTLYKKMEEASLLIKRDIIFAASLYVV